MDTSEARHGRPPLALIINDQEWSTRSLESILAPHGYAVLRAYTGSKGFERAVTARPDVIVIGSVLPDLDGTEVCRRLRADPRITSSTPILITSTGQAARKERLDALRAGAWDYLGHPLDAEELLLRFDAYVRAKHEADRARDEGLLDGLTGLYSLQGLARRARELASQAYRQSGPLACVVFRAERTEPDADMASAVTHLADRLRAAGRASDAIGRIGEAEFAVFAFGADKGGAEALMQRLTGGIDLPTEVSVGYYAVDNYRVANLQPQDMLAKAGGAISRRPLAGANKVS
jgi:CheY-like chemotaxis protein